MNFILNFCKKNIKMNYIKIIMYQTKWNTIFSIIVFKTLEFICHLVICMAM